MEPKVLFLAIITINIFLICLMLLPTTLWTEHDQFRRELRYLSAKTDGLNEEVENTGIHISCNIPKLDPHAEYALKLIAEDEVGRNKLKCLDKAHVRFHVDDVTSSLVQVEPNSPFWKNLSCCYFGFVLEHRNSTGALTNSSMGSSQLCQHMPLSSGSNSDRTTIPEIYDYVDVQCRSRDTLQMIYQDQFLFLRIDPKKDALSDSKILKDKHDQLNIIFIGLDSVSHVNFQRFMPKTRSYLLDSLSAVEFWGRNGISWGTQGNVLAALTGCRLSARNSNPESYTEDCRLIWTRFAEQGYRTFRSEDDEGLDKHFFPTLKPNRTGSSETDYDWIPYIYEMGRRNAAKGDYQITFGCFDHQWVQYLILDRVAQIARHYGRPENRNKPYFNFFWSATSTHDVIGYTRFMDEPFLALLKEINESGFLNNTALFFLSDHGMNYGSYSRTHEGATEFRMPFLYMVLPQWFRTKYSLATKNLGENAHRLSTPYDLHETMLDLLDPEKIIAKEEPMTAMRSNKSRGISLFHPIPLNRTCLTANIPTQYCICHTKTPVPNSERNVDVIRIADRLMVHLNQRLEKYKECDTLQLDEIALARVSHLSRSINGVFKPKSIYEVVVQTKLPQQGIFEATAVIESGNVTISGRVIRVNAYGNQSSCLGIYDKSAVAWIRSVCYCKLRD